MEAALSGRRRILRMAGSGSRLDGRVVVITGAGSGIGRASAVEFAAAGCQLVLAGRRRDALEETAALCRARGGSALVVEADVTSEADLRRICDEAMASWGRIDVWLNNAGTTYFARLDEGEWEAHRRVLETNLLGPMMAARIVLPVFRQQRAGHLINVGSVLSQIGQAFVPAYVVSKFGVRGLSEAVRVDVADMPGIHVSTVLPYAVDTPHFEEAANATGKRAYAMPPVQEPEAVARAVVDLAERPRRHRYVPGYIVAGVALHALWPAATERLLHEALRTFHLVGHQEITNGSLFAPMGTSGQIHGERRPVISRTVFAFWVTGIAIGLGARWLSMRVARPAASAPAAAARMRLVASDRS